MIVSSLILGIISIVLSIFAWTGVWWIGIISLALGILGIIFLVLDKVDMEDGLELQLED